jgi:hypothetical protein
MRPIAAMRISFCAFMSGAFIFCGAGIGQAQEMGSTHNLAGTGTVTEQKITASGGASLSGNCDNTTTNAGNPCNIIVPVPYLFGGGVSQGNIFFSSYQSPWNGGPGNVIVQTTGAQNVLRNATFTSWQHYKFLTNDRPASVPYNIGIASFTGSISGTTLTVTGSPTGALNLWQRLTDATNFTAGAPTAAGNNTLHFLSTTGINPGMWVFDVTNPRAIVGGITVVSVTSSTVVLSGNVGQTPNGVSAWPSVASGDTIAFSTIKPGTQIVGFGSGTGGAGAYIVNTSQTVSSETMQSAGGWSAEGIYVIPVGSAGSTVTCGIAASGGAFAPGNGVNCLANNNLSDLIYRFPIDSVDASRLLCNLSAGPAGVCVTNNNFIQPITLQVALFLEPAYPSNPPALDTKISCPGSALPYTGEFQACTDDWSQATTDLALLNLPACNVPGGGNVCDEAYTWVPIGAAAMEINVHCGNVTSGNYCNILGMELKQTPGATCNGTAPPCFQVNPGPLEVPETVEDINHNKRFAQLLGAGWENSFPGTSSAVETAPAFFNSTTHAYVTFPLPVAMRCATWFTSIKGAPGCPQPNVYFDWYGSVADFAVVGAGDTTYPTTALAVKKMGLNSIQLDATVTGSPAAGQSGFASLGNGTQAGGDFILIDSAIIGD